MYYKIIDKIYTNANIKYMEFGSIQKRMIGMLFILFYFIGTTDAKEKSVFSWQLAHCGFGLNFAPSRNNLELSAGLFNFFFDDYETNIGFTLSPLHIRTNIEVTESEELNSITDMSFVNICIYWNCLGITDMGAPMMLGPFSSLQYINIRNWQTFDYRDITINAGIKYIYKAKLIEKIDGNNFILEIETGYRYNYYDRHNFYFNIRVDLIGTLVIIGNIGKWFYL